MLTQENYFRLRRWGFGASRLDVHRTPRKHAQLDHIQHDAMLSKMKLRTTVGSSADVQCLVCLVGFRSSAQQLKADSMPKPSGAWG